MRILGRVLSVMVYWSQFKSKMLKMGPECEFHEGGGFVKFVILSTLGPEMITVVV